MKSKGIIRKMDELGRIVIPREYRKVRRINEGDPMSIVALENGDLLVCRVDFMGDLVYFGSKACEVLSAHTGNTVLLFGGNEIKAGFGVGAKTFIGTNLSREITDSLEQRKFYIGKSEHENFAFIFAQPIMSLEKVFGGIVMLSNTTFSSSEQQITSISAKILGEIIQNY